MAMRPADSTSVALNILLVAAGMFAITHGLQSLTRDDLSVILTLAFCFEVVAGFAAIASVIAGTVRRLRSGPPPGR